MNEAELDEIDKIEAGTHVSIFEDVRESCRPWHDNHVILIKPLTKLVFYMS